MPRYLPVVQVVELLSRPPKYAGKLAKKFDIPKIKVRALRGQWVRKIHGRCEACGDEYCECPTTRTGDNRNALKLFEKGLEAREITLNDKLGLDECVLCRNMEQYTVRNAIWRMQRSSDKEAHFRCKPCARFVREDHKRRAAAQRERQVRQPIKPRLNPQPVKVVAKKPRAAYEEVNELKHQPFAALRVAAV